MENELITVMISSSSLSATPIMATALHECEKFVQKKGLKVNAKESASIRVLPVKGKQSMKVITE